MVSKVFVIGCGMGSLGTLTRDGWAALEASELVVGSQRLLDELAQLKARKLALVASDAIARELHEAPESVASVVMSGDVGLYSGATSLCPLIEDLDVEVIPGISSLQYLCAKLRVSWQDVCVVSAHGRAHNAVGAVQSHAKTFLLTGGRSGVAELCAQLVERGLGDVRVCVGERLSYPDERISRATAAELAGGSFAPLSVMLVENDRPISRGAEAPRLPDDAFQRGDVPMTKEEVRELAICKLCIRTDDVVWDVGAGTGSVSIEAAFAAREGLVLAIERNSRAVELITKNRERFALPNIRVIEGEAPDVLAGLPVPDRVFVGGSAGQLEAILWAAIEANPAVRLCVAAITLETLSEALRCVGALGLRNLDIAQVTVAKGRELGAHHLMMGGNPIYLISADGPAAPERKMGEPCA